jgi:gas vesicle protein
MAKDSNQPAGGLEAENTGGMLAGLLAEEDEYDRRSLWWRLGSWGVAAVGAVTVALLANQSSMGLRREQLVVADDFARQTQQIRAVAKESQNEARRLASAIDTLNSDRDRLYSRVTVLEQGFDTVTGAIARQTAVAATPAAATSPPAAAEQPPQASQTQSPAPVVAPATTMAAATPEKEKPRPAAAEPAPATTAPTETASTTPAPTLPMASKSMPPPETATAKPTEPEAPPSVIMASPIPEVVAAASPRDNAEADKIPATASKAAVQRTEFGVDVGSANSLSGLRALWRGLLKSRSNAPLAALRPIIVVKESGNGLGMQLRLVAGPLSDAAAAAKICATLIENDRTCETTVFDGQRLAIKAEEDRPAAAKPAPRRRSVARRPVVSEEPPKKPVASAISSLFSRRGTTQ